MTYACTHQYCSAEAEALRRKTSEAHTKEGRSAERKAEIRSKDRATAENGKLNEGSERPRKER